MPNDHSNPFTDEEVLEEIISQMEAGVPPWRKPWSRLSRVVVGALQYPTNMWPSNVRAPKSRYGVFNGLILLSIARAAEYRTNLWVTREVLETLDVPLKPAERPVAIRRYDEDQDPRKTEPRLVYNIDQVENCEATLGLSFVERAPTTRKLLYRDCLALRRSLQRHRLLKLLHENDSDRAYYSRRRDVVVMPPLEQFFRVGEDGEDAEEGESSYWATLWHEVVHWTGHPTRLDRAPHYYWGDPTYAFEELIAEIGSAFLCAHLGIPDRGLQSASYIQSWCRALKEGASSPSRFSFLWDAAEKSSDAKDYILGKPKRKSASAPSDNTGDLS